ncbi:MAG TPA: non-homologous end-joining DNA ligase [Desulfuromonadaceae bacterium]|nr:non-homologous end-joining DNA ligase [Desulfuromonadaceae bacterium]
MPPEGTQLTLDGKVLSLSNLDKVLYPKAGFTKGQVIDYYIRIAPVLLPHLKDRALTLKRYPNGVEGGFFYEKKCPVHRPKWVKTAPVWSDTNNAEIHYCLANDLPTLVWAANLADLELHTSLAKRDKLEQPTVMVFDLDPGPGTDILDCAEIGLWLRNFFEELKLKSFAKTSGSKGLQVYVPLNTKVTFDDTKNFSREVAMNFAARHPDRIVAQMAKALRKNKVFIDWSQNDHHKTTVCVYSLRAKDHPTVSTPVKWDEVEAAVKKKTKLSFEADDVVARVKKYGDLFEPVLELKQKLPKIS